MSIEFRCHQCGKLLRVADETAGRQAKCPACGVVQQIPTASATPASPSPESPSPFGAPVGNPFGTAPLPPPKPGGEQNPYQSPAAPIGYEPHYGFSADADPVRAFRATPIDAGDIISRAWIIFKIHWGMCTLAFFLMWIIQVVAGIVLGPLALITVAGMGFKQGEPEGAIIQQFLVQIVALPLAAWLDAGLTLFMLKTARGEAATIADVFSGGRYFLAMLPARFLFYLAYGIGVMACIVPGVLLALMFSQYSYIIVDREVGPIESLRLSNQITSGNKGAVFLLYLSTIGIGLLGIIALCVGVFFAQGFLTLMFAVAYLAMSGQRTLDQVLAPPVYR